MSTLTETKTDLKGGQFLVKESSPADTYIREDITEEQAMISQSTADFIANRVHPNIKAIDKQEPGLVVGLLHEIAELGLLGAAVPEEYGGMGVDFATDTFINEQMGRGHSFSAAFAAHTGIGTLPILYFGTEEQKKKYLPGLSNGTIKASYCLTEPGSGSDALGAKTKAVLSEDGKN
jgi:alkylation response protein AidB-like acyl-CoA dehydrogenase